MFAILNIIVIGLVLLIAYWWANQGLFIAILHLVAVIAAGAIAFAVWEPLTYVQLGGTNWDGYAWGVTLIGVFAVSLFLIRFALDRIAPGNVDLPHWANLAFGFPVGGAAGIITMGIVVIGAGHIQTQTVMMGLGGYARSERTGQIEKLNTLWLPVHTITANLYSHISETSFLVPHPMGRVNPQLDRQAVSLIRDSYSNGRGAIAMPPDAATVVSAGVTGPNEISVEMRFDSNAVDYNEQLTLSSSQVRLISNTGEAINPFAWTQRGARYKFAAHGWYATSVPGQESAELIFHFRTSNLAQPFIQIRGTRFPIKQVREDGLGPVSVATGPKLDPNAPDITSAVEVTDSTRPIVVGTNNLPTGIDHEEGYFTTTNGDSVTFNLGGGRPSLKLRIQGYYAPPGTRIVQVHVDQQSPANIFAQSVLDRIADNAQLALVDANGNTYSPIGFMHDPADGSPVVALDPDNYMRTLSDLTQLPPGSRDEMKLIFRVTTGATIRGLKFGNVTIGICNIEVEPE